MHWKQQQRFDKVEGPWGQEDLYSSRIYSRRRLGEGSLFTRGEVNPNVSRCQIERCRSITQDWMVLEVLSDIVKT